MSILTFGYSALLQGMSITSELNLLGTEVSKLLPAILVLVITQRLFIQRTNKILLASWVHGLYDVMVCLH